MAGGPQRRRLMAPRPDPAQGHDAEEHDDKERDGHPDQPHDARSAGRLHCYGFDNLSRVFFGGHLGRQ